jgi:hypothetical protein
MKKLLLMVSSFAFVISLSACGLFGTTDDTTITSLTINGLKDITVEEDTTVDLLDGVTLVADDGTDYTSELYVYSDDCVIDSNNQLTGNDPGTCTINYTAVVDGVYVADSTTVTFTKKEVVIGNDLPLVKEWTFDSDVDLDGWSIYTANGGSIDMSIEDGTMKLVTTSGSQRYETRIDYQGIPLEKDYAYKVSFKMKSDIDGKKVHLNFGELLSSDPWFTPFKPEGVDIITLSTDWQEFSYTFMMEIDNQNGGPLFEMGNLPDSEGLDATIWIDDLEIEGGSGTDTIPPVIEGANDIDLFIGDQTSFDLMAGVTAIDVPDGDITSNIIVSAPTLDVNTLGSYVATYFVKDAAGNMTVVNRKITVKNDTDGPMFMGLEKVTIQTGDNFNPLSGVSAMDDRDGDVTSSIEVSGDYDINVAGEYTLTYTVVDAAGNETTANRTLVIEDKVFVDQGIVNNGSMDTYWYVWNATWNSTSVSTSFDGQSAILDIADAGAENWNIQLNQENVVLKAGQAYVVTLVGSSTVEREINVKLIADGAEYFETVTLTPTSGPITVVMNYAGGDITDGKLSLEMGGTAGDGSITVAPASVVTIESVTMEEYDGTSAVADTNVIKGSDFNEVAPHDWFSYSDGAITSSLVAMDGAAVLTYDGYGSNVWDVKVEQDGLSFVEGGNYRLIFNAKGDVNRDFFAGFWDGTQNFEKKFDLTTDWQTYVFDFVYDSTAMANLEFKLGATDNPAGGVFYLDDVQILRGYGKDDFYHENAGIVNNGSMDTYWYVWNATWNSTSVSTSFDGQSAILDIADAGAENWNIQLNQENVVLKAGQAYVVTLVGSSTVEREINVKLIADGAEYFETVTLTPTSGPITVVMNYAGGDITDGKLSLEMGGTAGDGSITVAPASVVTIESVTMEEYDGTSAVADTNVINNSSFEILNDNGWGIYADSAITATLDASSQAAVITYDGYGSEVWHVKLEQAGLVLVPGETYKLTFKVKNDVARDIEVGFWDGSNGQTAQFNVDTEFNNFTWVFVYDLNSPATLEFKLGATPNAAGGEFTIDNIVLELLDE